MVQFLVINQHCFFSTVYVFGSMTAQVAIRRILHGTGYFLFKGFSPVELFCPIDSRCYTTDMGSREPCS